MKLILQGHDYRYAAEQAMMSFLPEEKPQAAEEALPGEDCLISRLDDSGAEALLRLEGREYRGQAPAAQERPAGALERRRLEQKLVKTAVFEAVVAMTGTTPPWGSLTGVRPGKLAAKYLQENGPDEAGAEAWLQEEYKVSPRRAKLCVQAAREELWARQQLQPEEVVLYVGVPFCPTRCAYCSFVSHSVEKSLALIPPYVDALCREVEGVGRLLQARGLRVAAVYYGGGTPTTLSAQELERVMDTLAANIDLSACREYTVEAGRPDTITREKLLALGRGGVSRISINPQTMDDRVLQAIGRRHSALAVVEGYHMARECLPGVEINMDLIAGLPGDSFPGFQSSLEQVLALEPENVTVHTLTRKRGARLKEEQHAYPSDEEVAQMLEYSLERLGQDFAPYYLYRQKYSAGGFENVGWTLPGHSCLYNICMMEETCSVISLGAGGATKRVEENGKILRCFNKKYPYEYIESVEQAISDKESLFS